MFPHIYLVAQCVSCEGFADTLTMTFIRPSQGSVVTAQPHKPAPTQKQRVEKMRTSPFSWHGFSAVSLINHKDLWRAIECVNKI